jgi:hypothetical protein
LTKKSRKSRLWQFDPSVFQPAPKAGFLQRYIVSPVRSLGGLSIIAFAFAYPLILVGIALVFGAIIFWASLAGSLGLIWVIIKIAGYEDNYAGWDVPLRRFLGLVGGFGIVAGLYEGFIYINRWIVPIFAAILVLALIIGLRRKSNG